MDTAHGVLILTQAVTNPPPIAIIAPVGEQNLRNPSFQMDASGSGDSEGEADHSAAAVAKVALFLMSK